MKWLFLLLLLPAQLLAALPTATDTNDLEPVQISGTIGIVGASRETSLTFYDQTGFHTFQLTTTSVYLAMSIQKLVDNDFISGTGWINRKTHSILLDTISSIGLYELVRAPWRNSTTVLQFKSFQQLSFTYNNITENYLYKITPGENGKLNFFLIQGSIVRVASLQLFGSNNFVLGFINTETGKITEQLQFSR